MEGLSAEKENKSEFKLWGLDGGQVIAIIDWEILSAVNEETKGQFKCAI